MNTALNKKLISKFYIIFLRFLFVIPQKSVKIFGDCKIYFTFKVRNTGASIESRLIYNNIDKQCFASR